MYPRSGLKLDRVAGSELFATMVKEKPPVAPGGFSVLIRTDENLMPNPFSSCSFSIFIALEDGDAT